MHFSIPWGEIHVLILDFSIGVGSKDNRSIVGIGIGNAMRNVLRDVIRNNPRCALRSLGEEGGGARYRRVSGAVPDNTQ